MTFPFQPRPDHSGEPLGAVLRGAFAQPGDQALPRELLAMLVALDRAKRAGR